MAKMTEPTVPNHGRGCDGSESMRLGWRPKGVELPKTIAPDDHVPCNQILHIEAKTVKFDGTIIVSGETMD
jgi:hypothetical protein